MLTTNLGTTTTYFVGAYYEVANGVVTKYYYSGNQRIAMRSNGTLLVLVGDHLGSTSLTVDANGVRVSELRYKAWGEVRYSDGTNPTKYTYTGQYSYTADFGLMFYNARWVDVSLGRFVQADTIVPGWVQGLDRYAYSNNNPMKYLDPSGHMAVDDGDVGNCAGNSTCSKMLDTFTEAAIKMESPTIFGNTRPRWLMMIFGDRYDSIGPAKISDAIMEGNYGKPVDKDHSGQIGLGLRDGPCSIMGCKMDQNDLDVATLAMRTRISMRLDVCAQNSCTETDMVIVALLAADERFSPDDLKSAFKNFKSDNELVKINWEAYLAENWTKPNDIDKNKDLINKFSQNVQDLQPQDFPEIDWVYITDLAK